MDTRKLLGKVWTFVKVLGISNYWDRKALGVRF
jgi:hypothetical protein